MQLLECNSHAMHTTARSVGLRQLATSLALGCYCTHIMHAALHLTIISQTMSYHTNTYDCLLGLYIVFFGTCVPYACILCVLNPDLPCNRAFLFSGSLIHPVPTGQHVGQLLSGPRDAEPHRG